IGNVHVIGDGTRTIFPPPTPPPPAGASCCVQTGGCPGETGTDCPATCCCCPEGQRCCSDPRLGCCGASARLYQKGETVLYTRSRSAGHAIFSCTRAMPVFRPH